MTKSIMIIIAGASGSGKTTVSQMLYDSLSEKCKVAILTQDNFYNDINHIPRNDKNELNFDHPLAFDWNRLKITINDILCRRPHVKINRYNFAANEYSNEVIEFNNIDVLIYEGIYTLYDEAINNLADLKIFLQTDLDECFIRRVIRDTHNRGRDIDSVIRQWRNTVKPMFKKYIQPTMVYSDVIIPWNDVSENPLNLIPRWLKYRIDNGK